MSEQEDEEKKLEGTVRALNRVITFLTSKLDDYTDLQHICREFNLVLDSVNRASVSHQDFAKYLDGVEKKMRTLTAGHYEKKNLERTRL